MSKSNIIVNCVSNNPNRVNKGDRNNPEWKDEVRYNSDGKKETVFNPQSVTIRLDGHTPAKDILGLTAVANKSINGSGLLKLAETVAKANERECKLQIEADSEYKLVMVMSEDKEYLPYRHSGYTNQRTGDYVEQTYIKFEIPRPLAVGTTISDF